MTDDRREDNRRSEASIGARLRGAGPAPLGRRASDWGVWGQQPGLAIAEPAVARPKVLVVDDSPASRQSRRDALSMFEADIVEAATGSEALHAVRENDFALMLVDSDMPDGGGFELASLLRMEKRAEAVPIVFLLPRGAPAEALRTGYRMGAVDCLIDEPVDAEILRQKAHVFLDMHARNAELRAAVERAEAEKSQIERQNQALLGQQDLLQRQATHDPLTGLPNRLLFEDRLDGALKRAGRNRQHIALAIVNLDGFKEINEKHGFGAGDELINTTGKRLLQAVRSSDTVARLGGDEFAVVLEGLHSPAAADYLAHKMAAAVSLPCTLLIDADGAPLSLDPRSSIGIAVYPVHGQTREDLVAVADIAMRQSKSSGGGVCVYSGAAADAKVAVPLVAGSR
jgi:diguanylate cyclase (GGDEF)-like protein